MVIKRFSTTHEEGSPAKRLRQNYEKLAKKKADIYKKYLYEVDKDIAAAFDALLKACGHPLNFIEIEHTERTMGNEINYSRDHEGDDFRVYCKICHAGTTYSYNLEKGWEDEKLQEVKKLKEATEHLARMAKDAKEKESLERAELKRLQAKYT